MDGWLKELEELKARVLDGEREPKELPNVLALDEVVICEGVFQHRYNNFSASEAHIRELRRAIRASEGQPFDPITVFWVGDAWCCIDGHHRLRAYREEGYRGAIPVQVFSGSVEQAFARASEGNSKDKLAMTQQEKLNAGWRLVVGTTLSKSKISQASGVSERTIANMRDAMRKIKEGNPDQPLDELTWKDAQRVAKGLEPLEIEFDEGWQEARAQQMAMTLHKTFGDQPRNQPEIFLRAIEIYSSSLARDMAEQLGRRYQEDEDDFDDDWENHDF